MTWAFVVATRRVYRIRAGGSRGWFRPTMVGAPEQRAMTADLRAPWKSTAIWYFKSRTSWNADEICRCVPRESNDLRQALVFTAWTISTRGREGLRGPDLREFRAQSSSDQRSSTIQPMRALGKTLRRAVTAGR